MRRSYVKADANAKDLVKAIRQMGLDFLAMDGTLDGLIYIPSQQRLIAVDFKAHDKARLTEAQKKLQARGFPFTLIRCVEDVVDLMKQGRG